MLRFLCVILCIVLLSRSLLIVLDKLIHRPLSMRNRNTLLANPAGKARKNAEEGREEGRKLDRPHQSIGKIYTSSQIPSPPVNTSGLRSLHLHTSTCHMSPCMSVIHVLAQVFQNLLAQSATITDWMSRLWNLERQNKNGQRSVRTPKRVTGPDSQM
jgi:hypothetical protein